jgi:hypothetical protein
LLFIVVFLILGMTITSVGWYLELRPLDIVWGNVAEVATAITSALFLLGLIPAFLTVRSGVGAVRAEQRATQAGLLMHFNNEWRTDTLYESTVFVHRLRDKWSERGGDLNALADAWVQERIDAPADSVLSIEWNHRRRVAQFLRHTGYLLVNDYLEPDDVFSVNPEAKRLLEIIIPIENAVINHYSSLNRQTATDWKVARKWELDRLLEIYDVWFAEKSSDRFGPHPTIPVASYPGALPREEA